jgi:hypothetical protein
MTHPRTSLHPSSAVHLAATALALQGQYGVVTDLARAHGIRRQAVYDLRQRAADALTSAFTPKGPEPFALCVADTDIERAIVALRVMMPASVRDICAVLPVLFDVDWSYGSVWNTVHAAEQRAAAFNRTVSLSGIDSVALDELFSQGQPVLSGIDLDTGYIALLQPSESRSGEAWAAALAPLRDRQQLSPQRVVKDAGTGLSAGARAAWPDIEEHDDLFHAVYLMGQQQVRLERRAYRDIEATDALLRKRGVAQHGSQAQRRRIGQQLRAAKARMERSIARHDHYEVLQKEAVAVLELADRGSGRLRTKQEVVTVLTQVSAEMATLGDPRVHDVAVYLGHRAQGLGLYLDDLAARLSQAGSEVGGERVVEAVVRAYQASLMHSRPAPCGERRARKAELVCATAHLVAVVGWGEGLALALGRLLPVLSARHRASSAIENLHSVLRPYLVAQKHANAGFLSLFVAYSNLRTRPSGRFQGTSAYELLTGQRIEDWLTQLGFPPSPERAAARAAPSRKKSPAQAQAA